MAEHPRPGECIYANTNDDEWRFFLSYEGGQYHTVDIRRRDNCYAYYWKVDSTLQAPGSKTIMSRLIPGLVTYILLPCSSEPPTITWDENGAATADIERLETLHLRPDVSAISWTDGPGGMRSMTDTHIAWDGPCVDRRGRWPRRYHRVGYPASIFGYDLSKLADYSVSECGPAPSKDGTPVYVRSIGYYQHGRMHRDDGPSYTGYHCACSTGNCLRSRKWYQHGEPRIDRPFCVTCVKQTWTPRACRPTTVHRDGRLEWQSPAPERYTFWSHASYAQPVRQRFRAIAAASSVSGLANLVTWWVDA
jgi:hypothetical protein